MKFLGTSTKTVTTCDGVHDPKILSHQLLNTKKSPRFKKYNQVRISEIDTFCAREYSCLYLTNFQQKSFVDFGLQTQFDIGTALHWYYQNRSKVFNIYGFFKCLACEKPLLTKYGTRYFGQRPTNKCLNCGASPKAAEYDELYFRLESPYRIVGKIDGVVEKDGVYRLIDFKSYFEKPAGGLPIAKDVTQLSAYSFFYNYIPEDQRFPVPIDTSTSYLHYISKKFSFSEPILTYKVQPSEKLIEVMKERVRSFTIAAEGGPLPQPFDICIRNDFESGRAKNCPAKDLCKKYYQEGK